MHYDAQSTPDPDADNDSGPGIVERFEEFHQLNGHVYDLLVTLARRYRRATGEDKQSVQRLVEIARWDEAIRTRGEESFEINNDFRPFYARLIMWREEDLRGIFNLRRSHEADNWIAAIIRAESEAA